MLFVFFSCFSHVFLFFSRFVLFWDYNWGYNWSIIVPTIALILVGMALLGEHCWAILIDRRINCGGSILNLFNYMKTFTQRSVAQRQRDLVGMALYRCFTFAGWINACIQCTVSKKAVSIYKDLETGVQWNICITKLIC